MGFNVFKPKRYQLTENAGYGTRFVKVKVLDAATLEKKAKKEIE
jgi:hypothetical protein